MKFFVAFAAFVAVAVASPLKGPMPLPQPISIWPENVDIGPAIVESPVAMPCDVGPVIPSPVVIGELSPDQPAPLVQIIVNVNQAGLVPNPVVPKPDPVEVVDEIEETPVVVDPVHVVDVNPIVEMDPVNVVDINPVVDISPVHVVDITPGVAPEPVHVVDSVLDGVIVTNPSIAPEPVHIVDNVVEGVIVTNPSIAPEPVHIVDNVVDGVIVTPIHH